MKTIPPADFDADAALATARRTIEAEAEALHALARALDGPLGAPFAEAVRALSATRGRVIVTGMGKSGHIARKIAATMASTGRPAMFVHPAEASHGDLGMVTEEDCVLALSRSGETSELSDLLFHCRRLEIPIVAITFRAASTLAQAADVALVLPDCGEAHDDTPAPTTSTTMSLAMGDALAVALLEAKGFTADHFGAIHPGGKLGALLKRVRDVMRGADHAPLCPPETPVPAMLAAMTAGGIGAIGLVEGGVLVGVVTDGDLRRRLNAAAFDKTARALMTAAPKTIASDAPLADAIALMNDAKITSLFVVDAGKPVGVVHMHDLLSAGAR
ncbi:MAG: KpsF/GutQ family sugar-phosphate isomerase [Hyphomonadaceae bacterium]|nr:KpsF/GutQ family sugar-phosphate isomerase [Hyphomonadaceae bacterium]